MCPHPLRSLLRRQRLLPHRRPRPRRHPNKAALLGVVTLRRVCSRGLPQLTLASRLSARRTVSLARSLRLATMARGLALSCLAHRLFRNKAAPQAVAVLSRVCSHGLLLLTLASLRLARRTAYPARCLQLATMAHGLGSFLPARHRPRFARMVLSCLLVQLARLPFNTALMASQ